MASTPPAFMQNTNAHGIGIFFVGADGNPPAVSPVFRSMYSHDRLRMTNEFVAAVVSFERTIPHNERLARAVCIFERFRLTNDCVRANIYARHTERGRSISFFRHTADEVSAVHFFCARKNPQPQLRIPRRVFNAKRSRSLGMTASSRPRSE